MKVKELLDRSDYVQTVVILVHDDGQHELEEYPYNEVPERYYNYTVIDKDILADRKFEITGELILHLCIDIKE